MTEYAIPAHKVNELDETMLGFSIDLRRGRTWEDKGYSEKFKREVTRTMRVFSLEECMSSSESPIDSYASRGKIIPYIIME